MISSYRQYCRIVSSVLVFSFSQVFFFLTVVTGQTKPNIIFVITDDLDNNSLPFLPNLQGLFMANGTTFANYFVSSPTCCPSRASILRGQYVHNHQIYTNDEPLGGASVFYELRHDTATLATMLQSAGYKTILIGKYLNEYPQGTDSTYIPPGWSEWYAYLKGPIYYRYKLNENGLVKRYGVSEQDYITDVLGNIALDFLRRNETSEVPFFMYLSFLAPHNDVVNNKVVPPPPAPRHKNILQGVKAPRTPSFNEEDISDKPAWVRSYALLDSNNISSIDSNFQARLESMLSVDEFLVNLVARLDSIGKLDNTYIFFTSDNGFHLGQHRLPSQKSTPYEEDIKVPLLIRGPGVAANRTINEICVNIDILPTIADLVGVSIPYFVDGVSFKKILLDTSSFQHGWRDVSLIEFWKPTPLFPVPSYSALRSTNFLYVEWATEEYELYDISSDPYQLQNIYPLTDDVLKSVLQSTLNQLKSCQGNANCTMIISEIMEKVKKIIPSEQYVLFQNYPNPFNPQTIITFDLPRRESVKIIISNALGQKVRELKNETLDPGRHYVLVDARGLPSGVYFYTLYTPSGFQTKKLTIVK
jgi:N-acetylglucosamine-6-sulfatase